MSGSAREVVLGRIRTALAGVTDVEMTRGYVATKPADLGLFIERLEDYKAVVHSCTEDEVSRIVAAALTAAAIQRVVVPSDLDPSWTATVDRSAVDVIVDDGAAGATDFDGEHVAVITACSVAIAETGTIVLDCGVGQGRRMLSLIPDHHVCVVSAEQVVGGVPDAIGRLDPLRPLTWISGPSATSDIELRRVEGVHGPRHLTVVLVIPSTSIPGVAA